MSDGEFLNSQPEKTVRQDNGSVTAGYRVKGRRQGEGLIFTVFAAAVIGGISLQGGKGSMVGALLGVVLLGLIENILVLSQVPSYWVQATYGLIILAALLVNHLTSERETRRQV